MAMDIPAYPWTSMERMGREYPPTWEGGVARVCRGCAGAYLCKRLNSQRKPNPSCRVSNSPACLFYCCSCICLLELVLDRKGALRIEMESVCVYFRRSRDKRGSITRTIYKNIKKNWKSTFVCYISHSILEFVWKFNVLTKVRYEFSCESVCVYLRSSKDKRGSITRNIKNNNTTENQHFLSHLPLNSRIRMKTRCFCKGALRIQPRKRLCLVKEVER